MAVLPGSPLKLTLKRGALLAAANWPVTVVQAVADVLFKFLVGAPLVGGIFLVVLVVGAEPGALFSLGWRDLAATIVASLVSRPVVLASFLLSLAVAIVGGSLFVFLAKGGTLGVLVRAEREAGAIEQPPLHLHTLAAASRFSVEAFLESARRFFPRFARLGFVLMAVYLASAGVYLASVLANGSAGEGIGAAALVTAAFVGWITAVNLLYLLTQIVIVADDCGVPAAARRVAAFLRREWRHVFSVFFVVLGMVLAATAASVLAAAALGLIAFLPFLWLVVVPLQLVAWLLRGLVFQYIGAASIGAYLTLYRSSAALAAGRPGGAAAPYAADVREGHA